MNDFIIRKATINDSNGKEYVLYKGWAETYTCLFPDEIMEKITLERSVKLSITSELCK